MDKVSKKEKKKGRKKREQARAMKKRIYPKTGEVESGSPRQARDLCESLSESFFNRLFEEMYIQFK